MPNHQRSSLAEQLSARLPERYKPYAPGLAVVLERIASGEGGAAELHRYLAETPAGISLLHALASKTFSLPGVRIVFGKDTYRGAILFEEYNSDNKVALWIRRVISPITPAPAPPLARWPAQLPLMLLAAGLLGFLMATVLPDGRRVSPVTTLFPQERSIRDPRVATLTATVTATGTAAPTRTPLPTTPPAAPTAMRPATPLVGAAPMRLQPGAIMRSQGWAYTLDDVGVELYSLDLGDVTVRGQVLTLRVRVANQTGRRQPLPLTLLALQHSGGPISPSPDLSVRYTVYGAGGDLLLTAPIPADEAFYRIVLAFDIPATSQGLTLYTPDDLQGGWPVGKP